MAVSSLIAQGTEYPLKKPAGFHWDIFLLGLTTGVAGILGLPFPNGLIPQAPFHTASLCVTKVVHHNNKEGGGSTDDEGGDNKGHNNNNGGGPPHRPAWEIKRTHVVEQRVSNLAQGLLTLGTMTGPLLVVLGLIPQGVLAGLFFIMGYQALGDNGITAKLLFLLRDRQLTPAGPGDAALARLPRRAAVWAFVGLELLGFAVTFAITQTVAAVGFPVFIFLLIPARALLLPRWFTPQELATLDAPVASDFTMQSVGGTYGGAGAGAGAGADDKEGQGPKDEEEAVGGVVMVTTASNSNHSSSRGAGTGDREKRSSSDSAQEPRGDTTTSTTEQGELMDKEDRNHSGVRLSPTSSGSPGGDGATRRRA